MTAKELNIACLILASVCESSSMGAPEGHLYAALMGQMNLDTFNMLVAFIVRQGWVTKSGNVLRPTAKGRDLGEKVNAALARMKSEPAPTK